MGQGPAQWDRARPNGARPNRTKTDETLCEVEVDIRTKGAKGWRLLAHPGDGAAAATQAIGILKPSLKDRLYSYEMGGFNGNELVIVVRIIPQEEEEEEEEEVGAA
ncbi:hypothetical protein FOA52_001012 [Chlamydomonas sp. UWO 241]|nr:hypothetical protein FOA52_001012 [Chlamydomonas sp. UWO 241]